MLSNQEILEIKKIIYKLCSEKYRDDFEQEIYLIILQLDKNKIKELKEKNEFLPYIYGIIQNQYKSRNSAFYKKYIKWNEKRKDIEDRYI
jgi:hypothetical protein